MKVNKKGRYLQFGGPVGDPKKESTGYAKLDARLARLAEEQASDTSNYMMDSAERIRRQRMMETGGEKDPDRAVSPAGAQGYWQIMPTTRMDLEDRGLLANTLVITLGEFGRTPAINPSLGRDHFASAWSCSLSGHGVRGGVAYGKTAPEGGTVVEGEVNAGDLFATILQALGIDHEHEYMIGSRPVPLADFGSKPVQEVLA